MKDLDDILRSEVSQLTIGGATPNLTSIRRRHYESRKRALLLAATSVLAIGSAVLFLARNESATSLETAEATDPVSGPTEEVPAVSDTVANPLGDTFWRITETRGFDDLNGDSVAIGVIQIEGTDQLAFYISSGCREHLAWIHSLDESTATVRPEKDNDPKVLRPLHPCPSNDAGRIAAIFEPSVFAAGTDATAGRSSSGSPNPEDTNFDIRIQRDGQEITITRNDMTVRAIADQSWRGGLSWHLLTGTPLEFGTIETIEELQELRQRLGG